MKRFEDYGYTAQQAIQGVKSIDNWFSNQKITPESWNLLRNSVTEKGPQANPLRYDKKFIEICRSIPYSPKYQYQLLQLILQVQEEIMEEVKQNFNNLVRNTIALQRN